MPTEQTYFGPHLLPLETAGQDSPIHDLTVVGIADFAGFLIKDALDAKLAEMRGPKDSAAITDACPVANRFYWAHNGTFMRVHPQTGSSIAPLPGLWVSRVSSQASAETETLLEQKAESEI